MTRVAAVDCGTNTIKLLVADLDPGTGAEHELVREMRMVRLGQDVDRTGAFAPEALRRTFATLDEYARLVEGYDVDLVRFVATSAARDVRNRDEFADGVVAAARATGKPTVAFAADAPQITTRLRAGGVPVLPSPERAVRAWRALWQARPPARRPPAPAPSLSAST